MEEKLKQNNKPRGYPDPKVLLIALLMLFNIPIYVIDCKTGAFCTFLIAIYFVCAFTFSFHKKPMKAKEMVGFATQYATVQKRLLEDFEVPYAILDMNARIIWMNKQFAKVTGKDKA